jgi:hypothetical protein
MKRSLLTKRIFVLFSSIFLFWQSGQSQALLVENFEYTNGAILTSNGWSAHSGAGTNPVDVTVSGLTFTGYPSSPVAGAAQLDNTGEDINRVFAEQSSGQIYAAFLLKVNTIADGYFFHLGQTVMGTIYYGRVFIKTSGSNFTMGLSKTSEATVYGSTLYSTGTSYLCILKYNFITGTTNDEVSLYVFDSSIPSTEPVTATIPAFTTIAADLNLGSVGLRQHTASQKILVSGIRIAKTWTDAISDLYAPVPTFLPANSTTDVAITATPTIAFDEPVVKTDGSELTDADLASLVTFKKTSSTGDPVTFTATISASKKVITVTPSATLDNSQVYYLAIGAVKDASGNQTTGSNITFTTIAAATPTITLTYPVGGEVMYAGQAAAITWTSANITNVFVEVFAPDNDVSRVFSWIPFVPTTPAAAGHVDIVVPPDAPYGTVYKIRISDLDNPAVISTGSDFTVIPVATSLTDLRARCIVNDIVKLSSEVTMTFKRATGNQKYIQDANAGLLIYDPSAVLTTTLAVGDNFTGLEGKIATYGGVLEIIPTKTTVNITSSGNTVTIPAMTVLDFNTNYATYESMLIKITNVSFPDATGTATFAAAVTTPLYTVTDGTNSVAFYTFKSGEGDIVGSVIPAGKYDVTALALRFNTTPQIASRTIADFQFLTGIERTTDIKAELYPVPATDLLQVRNIRNVKTYEILDATGRMIRKSNVSSDSDLNIPVSELKHGIYYIRFNTPDGRVIRKFIK